MAQPQIIIKSLPALRNENPRLGEAFDDLKSAVENVALQIGAQPNGALVVPPNIQQLKVQVSGSLVDVAIVDNGDIGRAITYHLEYDKVASFSNPRGLSMGPWRTATLHLPNGTFYFRAYSQYPAGGPPSSPVLFAANPLVIAGSVALSLFSSEGSGTGRPNSGGGGGAGKVVGRPRYVNVE